MCLKISYFSNCLNPQYTLSFFIHYVEGQCPVGFAMSGNKCYGLTPTKTYSANEAVSACNSYNSTSIVSESFICAQRLFIWVC